MSRRPPAVDLHLHPKGSGVVATIKNAGYLHIPEGRRDDTTPPTPSGPAPRLETTTWTSNVAVNYHICGSRTDATLWCWGCNGDGQLGDGTTANRSTPAQVTFPS